MEIKLTELAEKNAQEITQLFSQISPNDTTLTLKGDFSSYSGCSVMFLSLIPPQINTFLFAMEYVIERYESPIFVTWTQFTIEPWGIQQALGRS